MFFAKPLQRSNLCASHRQRRWLTHGELIPHYSWQERPWLRATYLKVGYESIGVHAGLFERDFLIYSGELLTEAHSNDPNSPFRSHTLYSTILGREGRRSTDMPSPDAAEAYVNEFPQGPFIVEVHLILAGFYDDLYKVLTLEEDGRRIAYKYDCYKAYLTVDPFQNNGESLVNLRSDTMSDWLSCCPYMQTLSDILLILERIGLTVGSTVATSVVVQFRSGPRIVDSVLSEISTGFQAAVFTATCSKYTASGVRRSSAVCRRRVL